MGVVIRRWVCWQEAGVASGWNVWVWLSGGGCGWKLLVWLVGVFLI